MSLGHRWCSIHERWAEFGRICHVSGWNHLSRQLQISHTNSLELWPGTNTNTDAVCLTSSHMHSQPREPTLSLEDIYSDYRKISTYWVINDVLHTWKYAVISEHLPMILIVGNFIVGSRQFRSDKWQECYLFQPFVGYLLQSDHQGVSSALLMNCQI